MPFYFDIANTLIALISAIIAAISAIIAFQTLKNTGQIKETISVQITKEQFLVNRDMLKKHLGRCRNIVQKGNVRPANDSNFTESINVVLSSLERFLASSKDSEDYAKLMRIKNELEDLLSKHAVINVEMDIQKNTGYYGTLIGQLEELLNNGRVAS